LGDSQYAGQESMNIRCLSPGIYEAQFFPQSAVRRIPLLLQSMRHRKLSGPRFCKGTHWSYEVRPVKILGFYEACLGQDPISESIRSSYSYIPVRQNLHIFEIICLHFLLDLLIHHNETYFCPWDRPDTALPSCAPGNRQ